MSCFPQIQISSWLPGWFTGLIQVSDNNDRADTQTNVHQLQNITSTPNYVDEMYFHSQRYDSDSLDYDDDDDDDDRTVELPVPTSCEFSKYMGQFDPQKKNSRECRGIMAELPLKHWESFEVNV
ncbi:uncharacterized protein N7479_001769 [Penicillium vulpinum]|uniref:uncharacterized protein n=1 Tax=Penicillium vulpinum TaxID=29845 RepID=UPI0025482F6F|nr:uncharacterized protein N7479_001769 [Penicillium vulpinum]KAJ5971851.1 hypothetical protein N7479_001769 [Penicillium vulpinum]